MPSTRSDPNASASACPQSIPPSSGRPSLLPPRPVRLVVADADARLVDRTVDVLRVQGHEVEGVTSAEAFWAYLDREAPDVVLIDLLMRGIGGVPAIERIRATIRPPAVVSWVAS